MSTKKYSKVSSRIYDRVKKQLKKMCPILDATKKRKVNESDTSSIVMEILSEALGYDKFSEITTEYKIRGQYADYGVKIKDKLKFLVEVKSINTDLNEHHLFQVTSYAASSGVQWIILTNGVVWEAHFVTFGKPIKTDLIFRVNILDKKRTLNEKINEFILFSRESFSRNELKILLKEKTACDPENLKKIILSPSIVEKIRRELKKQSGVMLKPDAMKEKVKELIE